MWLCCFSRSWLCFCCSLWNPRAPRSPFPGRGRGKLLLAPHPSELFLPHLEADLAWGESPSTEVFPLDFLVRSKISRYNAGEGKKIPKRDLQSAKNTSRRLCPTFPWIFSLSTSLSPGFRPLFSSSFSPQVDSRGFCWTDQVLCVLGEGRPAHESKRSFYNQSNQSGQLRAHPRAWKRRESEGEKLLPARGQRELGEKKESLGNFVKIPLKSE